MDEDDAVATISQPFLVLWMLEHLDAEPGMAILEIGAGSGWNAGLLGALVSPGGTVDSVEIVGELAESARRGIARAGIGNVRIIQGDGGAPLEGLNTYDRVIFTAGAHDLPGYLYRKVREGGLLELVLKCPGGGDLLVCMRKHGERFESEGMRACEFVPLTGRARLKQLDPSTLQNFAPWPSLRDRRISERAFYHGGRGAETFQARTFALRTYLAVIEPRMRWFNDAFGLWQAEDESLALVTPDRIAVYGTPVAGARLDAHLDQWLARGMPSMATMSLRAYRSGTAPTPGSNAWLVHRPDSDFLWTL